MIAALCLIAAVAWLFPDTEAVKASMRENGEPLWL